MSGRLAGLARRREELVRRCAEDRLALAEATTPIRASVAAASHWAGVAGELATNPAVLGGVVATVILIGPRRTIRFVRYAWGGWQMWRWIRPFIPARRGAARRSPAPR